MEKKRRACLGAALVFGLVVAASQVAASDAGLGANWPNAPDLSRVGDFHAYKWVQGRVAYIQINDVNGNPILAVATRGGSVMVLPIGHPEVVRVGQAGAALTGQAVYRDDSIDVTVGDGGFTVTAVPAADALAPCSDPIECSKPQAKSAPVLFNTEDVCSDPIECSKPSASP